jgi:hypothetical protein
MARTLEVAQGGVATVFKIEGGLPNLQDREDDSAAGENVAQMQSPSKATG